MIDQTTFLSPPSSNNGAITVSALNRLVKEKLEQQFPLTWISGEISNLTLASSGHAYFSLKDANAQVRCVMFRSRMQLLGWQLKNGQKIEVRALVTLYEARGDFQLNVEAARQAGVGNLFEQFQKLKDKLRLEGLFDDENKRSLTVFPRTIGVISSPQAAALHDVVNTLKRRAPHLRVILYPTQVQGEIAATQIANAINLASLRNEVDTLILCRGGGSIEDLWSFNEEIVARAIHACNIPVISGVGHQTDFTIADFVADVRAATPTAAAELATESVAHLAKDVLQLKADLTRSLLKTIEHAYQRLDYLAQTLKHPAERITTQRQLLSEYKRRLKYAFHNLLTHKKNQSSALTLQLKNTQPNLSPLHFKLSQLQTKLLSSRCELITQRANQLAQFATSLDNLNPHAVLARGYSLVKNESGNIVTDSDSLEQNSAITVCFFRGSVNATVTRINDSKNNS